MAITLEQAKGLKPGAVLNHHYVKNADGTPARYKVTSVKTWKRDPERVHVRVKRGLREFQLFTQMVLPLLTIVQEVGK